MGHHVPLAGPPTEKLHFSTFALSHLFDRTRNLVNQTKSVNDQTINACCGARNDMPPRPGLTIGHPTTGASRRRRLVPANKPLTSGNFAAYPLFWLLNANLHL